MIFDCFLYNGEKDLLKIRLNELAALDIIPVIVQSDRTFSGKPKDFELLKMDWGEYPKFEFVHNHLVKDLNDPDPWVNERRLRNSIWDAIYMIGQLYNINDDSTIIISDVDEIPRASAIKDWNGTYAALMMDKFGFWLNCREGKQDWHRARIMKYSYLKASTPEEIRNSGFPAQIDNAGWHFSWQGGIDEVMRKFASFSHQEEGVQKHANRDELIRKIAAGESLWGSDKWEILPIDETFPQYVQDHQHDTLKHMIWTQ